MTDDINDIGKLTIEQLRSYYAHAHALKSETLDFSPANINENKHERIYQAINATGGWGHLYALPLPELLFLVFSVFEFLDEVKSWPNSANPHDAVLNFINNYEPPDIEVDELDERELGLFLSLIFVMRGNLDALFQYGVMLNRLVRSGPRELDSTISASSGYAASLAADS